MEDDPFLKLAELFGAQNTDASSGLIMGKIISAPDEDHPDRPLKVSVSGTIQEREDILKNSGYGEYGFSAGDQLLLLPIEEAQRYIIICKVVSA